LRGCARTARSLHWSCALLRWRSRGRAFTRLRCGISAKGDGRRRRSSAERWPRRCNCRSRRTTTNRSPCRKCAISFGIWKAATRKPWSPPCPGFSMICISATTNAASLPWTPRQKSRGPSFEIRLISCQLQLPSSRPRGVTRSKMSAQRIPFCQRPRRWLRRHRLDGGHGWRCPYARSGGF